MKRSLNAVKNLTPLTPLLLSMLLAAGWAQAQQTPSGEIRESADPSRAQQVEQKARALGDTVSPAEQGGASAGTSAGTSAGGSTGSSWSRAAPATAGSCWASTGARAGRAGTR